MRDKERPNRTENSVHDSGSQLVPAPYIGGGFGHVYKNAPVNIKVYHAIIRFAKDAKPRRRKRAFMTAYMF